MAVEYRPRIVAASRVITMSAVVSGLPGSSGSAGSRDVSDATAVAVLAGRVVEVGPLRALRERMPEAEVIDLGEVVLAPGFNDAHMHPTMAAEDLLHVDLSADRVQTRGELVAALDEAARTTPRGEWVRASRYDHLATTGGQTIDRADLDAISRDHPMIVVHVGAHWGIVNSAALDAGGITADSEPPPGGELGRDASGQLNGVVYEQALFDFAYPAVASRPSIVPESSLEQRLRGLRRFLRMLNAAGITSACDALAGPSSVQLLQEAANRNLLTIRVGLLLAYPHAAQLRTLRMSTGFGDERIRLVGIKAFVDGAVAGQTCLLEEPLSDHRGIQVLSDAQLNALVRDVHTAGNRVAFHANGDLAIAKLLDAVESVQRHYPRSDARHRIEHCTVVTPEIVQRIARAGMVAVPFGSYVSFHGDKLAQWYGLDMLERMFPHRWLLDAGVGVAGSSDYPCGPYEPLRAIESCVTRQSADGVVLGAGQRISADEALALYTTGSAYATGEERVKGRLAPGYLADFVALGADPLRTAPENIGTIPVLSTWVAGECVWSADGPVGADAVGTGDKHASATVAD